MSRSIRLATPADVPAIVALIDRSVRTLSASYYSNAQIESALRYVFGADTQLIQDGTYFVIENGKDGVVAAGGWSRGRTLYGGDQAKADDDPLLDPTTDPARVRAFFQPADAQELPASDSAAQPMTLARDGQHRRPQQGTGTVRRGNDQLEFTAAACGRRAGKLIRNGCSSFADGFRQPSRPERRHPDVRGLVHMDLVVWLKNQVRPGIPRPDRCQVHPE